MARDGSGRFTRTSSPATDAVGDGTSTPLESAAQAESGTSNGEGTSLATNLDTEHVPGEEGGAGHWVTDEAPAYTGTPCAGRHRWKGGNVCIRCGAPKPQRQPRQAATEATAVRGVRIGAFETMASMLWGGVGMGVEYQRVIIGRLTHNKDATEPGKVSGPVGRSLQLEAAIAGKRIDRAFHKASPFWYAVVARFMNKATWFTELVPLMVPPTVVGMAAQFPELVERFKPQVAALMVPVLVEIAKYNQQQAELMSKLEGYNAQTLSEAMDMLDMLIGANANHSTSSEGTTGSAA